MPLLIFVSLLQKGERKGQQDRSHFTYISIQLIRILQAILSQTMPIGIDAYIAP